MVPDLTAMASAAADAGTPLAISSAYRDYLTQRYTFYSWVNTVGYPVALLYSARPGHSEHQLGTAIDFMDRGGQQPWIYYNFATESRVGAWLAANAWRYGFVMSYPNAQDRPDLLLVRAVALPLRRPPGGCSHPRIRADPRRRVALGSRQPSLCRLRVAPSPISAR